MKGAVHHAIWGPEGIAWLLPQPDETDDPEHSEFQMLVDTTIYVCDEPTKHDISLVAEDVGDDGKLLGLFTHPPSVIQLFAANIIEVGYDPVDVITHELGHRFNYDHSLRPANVAMTAKVGGEPRVRSLIADDCPVCLVHRKLADTTMLLDGLRKRAHLQHEIPLGLGGTIPQCYQEVTEARSTLAMVTAMMPGRAGQIRNLDGMLNQLQVALSQWMSPEDVSEAYALAYRACDRAYDLAHAYWLNALYGSAQLNIPVS